jgi:hypothetical protein
VRRTALLIAVASVVALGAPADATADGPLDEARRAMENLEFTGTVRVTWIEGGARRSEVVRVRAANGSVHVDGPGDVLSSEQGRSSALNDRWRLLWFGTGSQMDEAPPMARKYSVRDEGPTEIAGRSGDAVVIVTGGRVRERVTIDDATHLILARAQYDADGRLVHESRFTRLAVQPSITPHAKVAVDGRGRDLDHVDAPYRAPGRLADGYARLGTFRRGDATQVLYSDGLYTLSVFEQPGHLDRDDIGVGALTAVTVGDDWSGWSRAWPGGQVVTWQAGPLVYTVVGDAPLAEVLEVAGSLPEPAPLSAGQRVLRGARALVDTLSGRR